jgi:hypothetical protein
MLMCTLPQEPQISVHLTHKRVPTLHGQVLPRSYRYLYEIKQLYFKSLFRLNIINKCEKFKTCTY